jgi:hypothetical protein
VRVVVTLNRANFTEEEVHENCVFRLGKKKVLIVYNPETGENVTVYTKHWLKVEQK